MRGQQFAPIFICGFDQHPVSTDDSPLVLHFVNDSVIKRILAVLISETVRRSQLKTLMRAFGQRLEFDDGLGKWFAVERDDARDWSQGGQVRRRCKAGVDKVA